MSACPGCAKWSANLGAAQRDMARARGLLQRNGNRFEGRYVREVAKAKETLVAAEGMLEDHIEEDHDGVRPVVDHSAMRVPEPVKPAKPEPKRVLMPRPVRIPYRIDPAEIATYTARVRAAVEANWDREARERHLDSLYIWSPVTPGKRKPRAA